MLEPRLFLPAHRRQVLHGTGLALALLLSGCLGDETDPDDGSSPLTADELDIDEADDGTVIVRMIVKNESSEPHDGSVTAIVKVDGETVRATTDVSIGAGTSEPISIPTDVSFEATDGGVDITIEFG